MGQVYASLSQHVLIHRLILYWLQMGETLSRLASVQRNMDKLDESIKSLEQAQKMLGQNDIYSAVILSKLSVVYRYKGDSERSLEFAEQASKITDQKFGSTDHPGKICTHS